MLITTSDNTTQAVSDKLNLVLPVPSPSLIHRPRCVSPSSSSGGSGGGGWTAPQFRRWLANYLRELQVSTDAAHRALVLPSARPLLENDPTLGLSVFVEKRQYGISSHGLQRRMPGGVGRRGAGGGGAGGLAPQAVVSFLKTISPSEVSRVTTRTCVMPAEGEDRRHFFRFGEPGGERVFFQGMFEG